MKNVYIVGGNGFARECYHYIKRMSVTDASINFAGFLGHNGYGHTVDYKDLQPFYRGEVADHTFADNDYAVIGAGYPELRSVIYNDLKKQNAKFFTILVDVQLDKSVEIGEANVFVPPFYPVCDIKIGSCNVFNGNIALGHDCVIGDCNFFGPRSQVLGEVIVGSNNVIGANSVLLPHCKIGSYNKISPLSAVYKGCRDHCYMHGNPAVKIGEN